MQSQNTARVDDAYAAPRPSSSSSSSSALRAALATYVPNGPDVFVDEVAASEYLGRAVRTLRNDRYRGGGPKFRKFGCSVRYAIADLIEYTSRSYGSTAQVPRFERNDENNPSES